MAEVATSSLRAVVEAHRDEIRHAVARHRGRRVRLFGSVARGEVTPASDVDFLVDFEPGSSLFDLHRLVGELEGAPRPPGGRRITRGPQAPGRSPPG